MKAIFILLWLTSGALAQGTTCVNKSAEEVLPFGFHAFHGRDAANLSAHLNMRVSSSIYAVRGPNNVAMFWEELGRDVLCGPFLVPIDKFNIGVMSVVTAFGA